MKKILFILVMAFLVSSICESSALAFSSQASTLPNPEQLKYPPLKFQLPQAERKSLTNGISLHIAEDHELPLVKITALIKVGNSHDPSGKEGLAELTGKVLLTGGTRLLTGDEIDDTLAFIAADIRCDVYLEHTLLTLSVLQKDVDRALEIFSSILKNPVFEQRKFEAAKDLKIEELRRISDDPQGLAFRSYRKLLYKGDPRGRLSNFASLDKIGRLDLMTFHQAHFSPKNVLLAVSGDLTGNEALLKFNRHLGDWQEGNRDRSPLPPPVGGQKASLSLLPKETPQSIIIYGHLGPGISSPDFYPFTMLDFILGSGGFQSRIFQEIRTNRGLAYSSGSFYQGRKDYGVFEAYAFTKAGATAQVLNLMKEIIGQIQVDEISPKELQGAKNALANNFIFTFKTADDVAFQKMMLEYKELPRDFLETYPGNIAAVKAEDVKRVALKYLDSQKAVILVVGQEKEFDAPLSQFGTVNREDTY
jgi:zinc protease